MKHVLLFLILSSLLGHAQAQSDQYPPRHEELSDPSLMAFTESLKAAVQGRDVAFIEGVLDPEVISGFDGEGSPALFMETWEVADTASFFWPMMAKVLALGGTRIPEEENVRYRFVFPYTYAIELDEEDDYLNMGVITGSKVNVRAEPGKSGKVLGQLTYQIVRFQVDDTGYRLTSGGKGEEDPDWYRVATRDGKLAGWVYATYVADLVGPRLFLYQDGKGDWKISCFVVGD